MRKFVVENSLGDAKVFTSAEVTSPFLVSGVQTLLGAGDDTGNLYYVSDPVDIWVAPQGDFLAEASDLSFDLRIDTTAPGNVYFTGANGVTYTSSNLDATHDLATAGLTAPFVVRVDIPTLAAATALYCFSNGITKLDVTSCAALVTFLCYNNSVTTLDVTNCTALTSFQCHLNSITTLDVTNCTALTSLNCRSNDIAALDVANCTVLTDLRCHDNTLDTAQIDGLLADLVTNNQTNGTAELQDNAVPSGAGVTDRSTLQSRGWTVTTDA